MTTAMDQLLAGLCDDAAIVPPGNLPLDEVVPAHVAHLASEHRALVGPFIVSAAQLAVLEPLLAEAGQGSFGVAITVPAPDKVAAVLGAADAIPSLRVAGLEAVVPDGFDPEDVVPTLEAAVSPHRKIETYVELPRDERRPALLAALAGTPSHAKLRTSGVRADLYPDERELAGAVTSLRRIDFGEARGRILPARTPG